MLLFDFRYYCRHGHRRLWDDVWTWDIDHTRIMFFVYCSGQWIGRSYDSLSALGLSAIVILLDNPYLLWYAGFLLSFAAVLGIVAVGQTLIKIKSCFFTFSENFLVSFAIQFCNGAAYGLFLL